jgi:hypothetical protein
MIGTLAGRRRAHSRNASQIPRGDSRRSTLRTRPGKFGKLVKHYCRTCKVACKLGILDLRNRLGDAHGQGKRLVKPLPRHAELAVNMAGSVASFLLATFEAKK